MMATILHVLLALVALFLIAGTLLNFSKHPHWFVRAWDFPRVLVAVLATVVGVAHAALFHDGWADRAILAGLALVVARQAYLIYPYTPLGRTTVRWADTPAGDESFRLLISNVRMENREHDRWARPAHIKHR